MPNTLFFIILLNYSYLHAQWEWQNPSPQGNDYNGIFFSSPSSGWLVGDCGTIIHTENGGETWEFQDCGLHFDLNDVFFTSELCGWTGGENGHLYKTVDGGQNWQGLSLGWDINFIWFRNEQEGWAGCWRYLYHTTDSGENWDLVTGDFINLDMNGVAFPTPQKGWAIGAHTMEDEGKVVLLDGWRK